MVQCKLKNSNCLTSRKRQLFFSSSAADFTFVCPSELIAFDHRLEEFKNRGVEAMAFLTSFHNSTHLAWKTRPSRMVVLVKSDSSRRRHQTKPPVLTMSNSSGWRCLARLYSAIHKNGCAAMMEVVKHAAARPQHRRNAANGDDLQFFEEICEVCPAGWNKEARYELYKGVALYLAKTLSWSLLLVPVFRKAPCEGLFSFYNSGQNSIKEQCSTCYS